MSSDGQISWRWATTPHESRIDALLEDVSPSQDCATRVSESTQNQLEAADLPLLALKLKITAMFENDGLNCHSQRPAAVQLAT